MTTRRPLATAAALTAAAVAAVGLAIATLPPADRPAALGWGAGLAAFLLVRVLVDLPEGRGEAAAVREERPQARRAA